MIFRSVRALVLRARVCSSAPWTRCWRQGSFSTAASTVSFSKTTYERLVSQHPGRPLPPLADQLSSGVDESWCFELAARSMAAIIQGETPWPNAISHPPALGYVQFPVAIHFVWCHVSDQ